MMTMQYDIYNNGH